MCGCKLVAATSFEKREALLKIAHGEVLLVVQYPLVYFHYFDAVVLSRESLEHGVLASNLSAGVQTVFVVASAGTFLVSRMTVLVVDNDSFHPDRDVDMVRSVLSRTVVHGEKGANQRLQIDASRAGSHSPNVRPSRLNVVLVGDRAREEHEVVKVLSLLPHELV